MSDMAFLPPPEINLIDPDFHIITASDAERLIPVPVPPWTPPNTQFQTHPTSRASIICDVGLAQRLQRITLPIKRITRIGNSQTDISDFFDNETSFDEYMREKLQGQKDKALEKQQTFPSTSYLYLITCETRPSSSIIELADESAVFVDCPDPDYDESELDFITENAGVWWL